MDRERRADGARLERHLERAGRAARGRRDRRAKLRRLCCPPRRAVKRNPSSRQSLLATPNKCLALIHKSRTGGEATKKRSPFRTTALLLLVF